MFHERQYASSTTPQQLLAAVYGWMSGGLLLSTIVAFLTASSPAVFLFLHKNPLVIFGLFFIQLGIGATLTTALPRLSFATTLGLFFLYAGSMGLTLSSLLIIYTAASLVSTFLTCAGMFGAMALYGHFTRADLSGIGSICIMFLWGLCLAMIVNLFLGNAIFELLISAVAVAIFTLFIAYDAQRIKYVMAQQMGFDEQMAYKVTVLGAFCLYLDFINLFIHLLQFMGRRREQ
ncbi:Bax inhibitor-1/YccA family protein [bacterium]|nr:MAG: Bax inhibitor-1/YccA family protein [bacterium]QQR61472.1 MAG: Bax inhibitor-1/YccA family protein [bacterium]QQR63002.1 MAG: Bax inhibitor-1/YccA family protein [bacterium]